MNLKNYTSSVPVINSIGRIEHRLAQAGATFISKAYAEDKSGRSIGMIFQIPVNNVPVTFKLPAKTERVFDFMIKQRNRPPKQSQKEAILMQADRTAWKILSDWIDIQVSMIQLDQAEAIEIFLPYVYDGKTDRTLFDKMKEGNFKQLNQYTG